MTAATRLDHFELLFPSEYIKHVELQGKDVTLTIKKVWLDNLQMRGGRKKKKGVLAFEETEKKLVLGRENAEIIVGLYGKYTSDWVGKRITIYPDPNVMFGTQKVGGTRIRNRKPEATKARARTETAIDPAELETDDTPPSDEAPGG